MLGRIKAGWYREANYDPDHVLKVTRIGKAWIATLYSRRRSGPCACGTVLRKDEWPRLEPADPVRSLHDDSLANL